MSDLKPYRRWQRAVFVTGNMMTVSICFGATLAHIWWLVLLSFLGSAWGLVCWLLVEHTHGWVTQK